MIDQSRKWNRLTIVSILASVLQYPLFYSLLYLINRVFHEVFITMMLISFGTVILNITAIKKAKNANEKGKGFAITGVCLSVISFLLVLWFYIMLLIFRAQYLKLF